MPPRNSRRKKRRLSHRQRQRRHLREYYCQKRACQIFDGLENTAMSGWGRRQKSYYDNYGGGEWSATAEYYCDCHQLVHTLEVIYVKNPIDVNLMAWYQDGKRLSYIMM